MDAIVIAPTHASAVVVDPVPVFAAMDASTKALKAPVHVVSSNSDSELPVPPALSIYHWNAVSNEALLKNFRSINLKKKDIITSKDFRSIKQNNK